MLDIDKCYEWAPSCPRADSCSGFPSVTFVCFSQCAGSNDASRGKALSPQASGRDRLVDPALDHDPGCGPALQLLIFSSGPGSTVYVDDATVQVVATGHEAASTSRPPIRASASLFLLGANLQSFPVKGQGCLLKQQHREPGSSGLHPHQPSNSSRHGSAGHRPRSRSGPAQQGPKAKVCATGPLQSLEMNGGVRSRPSSGPQPSQQSCTGPDKQIDEVEKRAQCASVQHDMPRV